MPSSDPRVIESICREIIKIHPKRVLDIGVGFGKWGMLAREYTDIWNYRFYQDEWETKIDGIEIHARYQNPIWQIYTNIFAGRDAFDVVEDFVDNTPPLEKIYDLAMMVDVLEHFEKEKGQDFLDMVMKISNQFIVSYCNSPQKDVRDNKHEDHISTWEDKDFFRFSRRILCGGPGWGVYLLSN